jgi:DNA-directed RNA polymerase subunit M/transcription elongation factor TFIIS
MHKLTFDPREPPFCPSCGERMRHARALEQGGERSNVFDCSRCRVSYTARELLTSQ